MYFKQFSQELRTATNRRLKREASLSVPKIPVLELLYLRFIRISIEEATEYTP